MQEVVAYRADIDGLRAVAIGSVLGFHAFPGWITGGFIGVDVFFVVSGFLISSIIFSELALNRFSLRGFYARRIRRIIPALIVILVACYFLGWLVLLPQEYKQLGAHIVGAGAFISNFVLWFESGYFDNSAATKPLLHLWSLGIEEQFYVIWPILVALLWKRAYLLLTISALALASFGYNLLLVQSDVLQAFYSPASRLWELMAGSALAYLPLRKQVYRSDLTEIGGSLHRVYSVLKDPLLNELAALVGVGLIGLTALSFTDGAQFPGWRATLPVVGAMLIIWAGPTAWLNRRLLANKLMVAVGLISYPLYLWHWPLLAYANVVEGGLPPLSVRIGIVIASILLACWTRQFIENPLRNANYGKRKVTALLSCTLIATIAGYLSYSANGFPKRYPLLQQLEPFSYDIAAAYRQHECFLESYDEVSRLDRCVDEDRPEASNRPVLVLWGDSFAAHLLPGIRKWLPQYRIVQYTAASCPPVLGYEVAHCGNVVRYVAANLPKLRAQQVVLAANWVTVGEDVRTTRLVRTIAELERLGVSKTTVIGTVPQWIGNLPTLVYNRMRHDIRLRQMLPERLNHAMQPGIFEFDNEMMAYLSQLDIRYISLIKLLCNSNGCLVRADATADSLLAWDSAHLTEKGSEFVVHAFAGQILEGLVSQQQSCFFAEVPRGSSICAPVR